MDAGRLLRTARASDEGQPAGTGRRPDAREAEDDRHRAGEGFRHHHDRPRHGQGACSARWGRSRCCEKGVKKLKTENGWIVIPTNFANYGTDYETRAGIALIGLGGIWPQDVSYPTAFLDGDDKPLDGANRYVLHFDEGPDAAQQHHLVGLDVRPAGLLRGERYQPLQPRPMDAAAVQRTTARSTSTSRRVLRARRKSPTGCLRPRAARSTSRCASSGRRKRYSTAPTSSRR